MQNRLCLAAALLCVGALNAQRQNPPAAEEKVPAYVRRFSAGPTLSVLVLTLVPERSVNNVTTTPPVDSIYTTKPLLNRRVGYGFTAQVAVSERLAVNSGMVMRWIGYKMTSDILEGVFNPNATTDTRKQTVLNEDTRARLYDIPVTLRYYGKDRHHAGPRWFLEGGGVLRKVARIKTSVDTTVGSGVTQCCNTTPAHPSGNPARGVVAGAGVQVIDPVGIRLVPQVRYTRWMSEAFSSFSTNTRRDQVEAMISLTF